MERPREQRVSDFERIFLERIQDLTRLIQGYRDRCGMKMSRGNLTRVSGSVPLHPKDEQGLSDRPPPFKSNDRLASMVLFG